VTISDSSSGAGTEAQDSAPQNAAPDGASTGDSTPANTGSRGTRRLGVAALLATAALLLFGLVLSPPEASQAEAVRLFYLHLPSVAVAYLGFFITMVASIIYLRKGSLFWDLVAGSAAEIGVVFSAFMLISGSLWGRPTWGVYWVWDPRLTSTTVMVVMYIGYLAVRRLELPPEVRSRRAAVLGIVSFLNVIVVRYSVKWWRGVHQGETVGLDTQMDGLQLFSFFVGLVAFMLIFAWMLIHRFRISWLRHEIDEQALAQALAERRAETNATGLLGRKN